MKTNRILNGLAVLAAVITFSSCTYISFEEPMPPGVAEAKKIPAKFQGKWVDDEGDSFTVDVDDVINSQGESLSEEGLFVVKTEGDYLYVNLRDEDHWHLAMGKLEGSEKLRVIWFSLEDESIVEELKKITPVKEIYNDEGKLDRAHINPSKQEWATILRKEMWTEEGVYHREK